MYLQIHADALVDSDRELAVDVLMGVAGRMSGEPVSEDTPPFFESMAHEEYRVVLRCRPYETFAPPRPITAGEEAGGRGIPGAVTWVRRTRADQWSRWSSRRAFVRLIPSSARVSNRGSESRLRTDSCATSSGANGKSLPKTTWSQPTSSASDESA